MNQEENKDLLALAVMVKNEIETIELTITSSIKHVDKVIILDTGSTDGTQELIRLLCEQYNKPLIMKESPFVDFSVSRNQLLEMCEGECKFAILLDANDQLMNGANLRKFCEEDKSNNGAYIVNYICDKFILFQAVRLVKPGNGWLYKGKVHEVLCNGDIMAGVCDSSFELRQNKDNIKDIIKTRIRMIKDIDILTEEITNDPSDTRSIFYLANTYSALGEYEDSFKYYKLRASMDTGYKQEIFWSNYKCGVSLSLQNKHDESLEYFMKALECSQRVEPYIFIVKYYQDKDPKKALEYCKKMNVLDMYVGQIFVDINCYNFSRWHLTAAVCLELSLEEFQSSGSCLDTEYFKLGSDAVLNAYSGANKDAKNMIKTFVEAYMNLKELHGLLSPPK
jgi:glycosyltransferase involved in cell wall biosynthesis